MDAACVWLHTVTVSATRDRKHPGDSPASPQPRFRQALEAACEEPVSLFLLLPFALPLAGQLVQLLIQPPLELGPLGRVQGPVLGPTAGVQDSFPADSLPGMGASPLPAAMDLGGEQQSVLGREGTWPCSPAHHSSEGLPRPPAHGPVTCRLHGWGGLHTLARLGTPTPHSPQPRPRSLTG